MRRSAVYFVAMCAAMFAACGPSAEELAAGIVAQTASANHTATAAVGSALSAALTENAPTYTPSITFTPTLTQTATTTPTGTPGPVGIVNVAFATMRGGPGTVYQPVQDLREGDPFEIIGVHESGEWLFILLPGGEFGWVPVVQVEVSEDIEGLPVLEAPPTPTPAPVFTVTLSNAVENKNTIHFTILTTGQNIRIPYGESRTIKLEGGYYTIFITWAVGGANTTGGTECTVTALIQSDVFWQPVTATDLCRFP